MQPHVRHMSTPSYVASPRSRSTPAGTYPSTGDANGAHIRASRGHQVLVDGETVGIWRRSHGRVAVEPWRRLTHRQRDAVAAEAESLLSPGRSKAGAPST